MGRRYHIHKRIYIGYTLKRFKLAKVKQIFIQRLLTSLLKQIAFVPFQGTTRQRLLLLYTNHSKYVPHILPKYFLKNLFC